MLLGAVTRVAAPLARSLSKHGIRVVAASLSPADGRPLSTAIHKHVSLPSVTDPELFLSTMLDAVANQFIDTLMPCSDAALAGISANYDRLRIAVHPGCPPPDIVAQVLDKRRTMDLAQELGIDVPNTFLVHTREDLLALHSELRFPIIAKPRDTSHKVPFKVRYFFDVDSLKETLANGDLYGRVLIQEYCKGQGVGIGTIISNGEPLLLFQHRRLKELPSSGGVSVLAVAEKVDSNLARSAVALLQRIGWEGVAMVEFRQDVASGRCVLMEINGRYWGSIALPLRAGVDFPWIGWQLIHGIKPQIAKSYRVGTRVRWLAGDAERLIDVVRRKPADSPEHPSRLKEVFRFFSDCLPPTRSSCWAIRDPAPELAEILFLTIRLSKRALRDTARSFLGEAKYARWWELKSLGLKVMLNYVLLSPTKLLSRRRSSLEQRRKPITSVLFVCKGNIIRSPMAAELLRLHLGPSSTMLSKSAGLRAVAGAPAHPWAVIAARELGISLDGHRAQRVSPDLVKTADVVFVMDRVNLAEFLSEFPAGRHKVFLLGKYAAGNHAVKEITDPDGTTLDQVRRCFSMISHCVKQLESGVIALP